MIIAISKNEIVNVNDFIDDQKSKVNIDEEFALGTDAYHRRIFIEITKRLLNKLELSEIDKRANVSSLQKRFNKIVELNEKTTRKLFRNQEKVREQSAQIEKLQGEIAQLKKLNTWLTEQSTELMKVSLREKEQLTAKHERLVKGLKDNFSWVKGLSEFLTEEGNV